MSGADPDGAPVEVAIVGAGFAGLGTGIQLARRGCRSFVILERADDVGGTWRDNRYPGVCCDVPAHLYCFSFLPNPHWSQFFAPGEEIQEYLRSCARSDGLYEHIRFGAEMHGATWHESTQLWRIDTGAGVWWARTLVMAAGRLSEPSYPDVPGIDDFDGPVLHTAGWQPGLDLSGRRVGVVGTGASAAQLVPGLAGSTAGLVVFQRSAPYVVPRGNRAYSVGEREHFARNPAALRDAREQLFAEADAAIGQRHRVRPDIDALRARALQHLADSVPDPQLRARLTPDYEIGCKRVLLSDDYYPALNRQDVVLEPGALDRVEGSAAVSAHGRRHELDALVLATGFLSTRPPFADRIAGRGGRSLAEHWSGGMTAYASTTVHGFPNMFVLDGPNASLGHNSAIEMIETQIDYVLGALQHLRRHGARTLEVSLEAERAYTRDIDRRSRSTVWLTGGCRSWYVDERSGRLTLLWPDSARAFRERNGTFDPAPYVVQE
ncbi:NAD(P)/FAD-dependent oxidoreductase [Saccharopolyspora sp. HNM0983]|uniref:NAD(P)/FAD-dependent oxidoreductase n=1 Tax=Saccharopolyspora montiporae TaxID=2781240 RepID=A0A929FYY7_9PSEU|nr:NAD(P)/FAD-dependent oxidoreductase [Saccharopolyspora sp. HNM0983]